MHMAASSLIMLGVIFTLAVAQEHGTGLTGANKPISDKICIGDGDERRCAQNFAHPVDADHDPRSADQTCFEWCSIEACKTLSGNLTQECGLCASATMCNPAADDFEAYKEPTTGNTEVCREDCETKPCDTLHGNPAFECGGCSSPFVCRPGADHFDDFMERHEKEKREL